MPDHVMRIDTLKHAELLEQLPHPRWRDVLRAADRRPAGLPAVGVFEFSTPTDDRKRASRDGGVLARRSSDRDHKASVVALIHWDNAEANAGEEALPDLYQAVVQVQRR